MLLLFCCLAVATLFVMAEMALASSNRSKLARLRRQGDAGAAVALRLLEQPALFLSTVQVGITFTGVVAALFSGSELSAVLAPVLAVSEWAWLREHALVVAETLVSLLIGSVTIVFAEIIPKRLAMAHAESFACLLARPMAAVAWVAYPLVGALGWTADSLLRVVGWRRPPDQEVSEEDIRMMVDAGHAAGQLHAAEKRIMLGALDLDVITVAQIMTPSRKVVWLDLREPDEENWRRVIRSGHTWFPVHRGSPDDLAGVVSVKRLWANLALTGRAGIKDLMTEAATVSPGLSGAALLQFFQDGGQHVALVSDEFGRVRGIVTINDILVRLVGRLPSDSNVRGGRKISPRPEGGWFVDADASPSDMRRAIGWEQELPFESEPGCATMAGLLLKAYGAMPQEGEVVNLGGLLVEVLDLDGTRIDKLLVRKAG